MTKKRSTIPYYICAFLTGNTMGALFSWSYFRTGLAELFPTWTARQLSAIFSVHNVVVMLLLLVSGQMIKKVSPRVINLIGAICILVGFGAFPLIPTDDPQKAYIMLFICFALIAASASSFCGLTMVTVFPVWAPKHVGAVTGFAIMGANISPMYFGALCGVLIPKLGVLQAVRVIGILTFLLIAVTIKWCTWPKPEDNIEPPARHEDTLKAHDYTLREMLSSPMFWTFFLICGITRGVGLVMSDLGGTIAAAAGLATILGLVFSPASAVASLGFGFLSDKLKFNRAMWITAMFLTASAVCLLVGGFADVKALLVIGLALGGISFGAHMTVAASSVRFLFGNKYYGQNYSVVNSCNAMGAVFGIAAGALIDAFGGAFTGVYGFIAALAAVCILLTSLLKGLEKRANRKFESEASEDAVRE